MAMMSDRQVVILCGGLGTRLRPLTDNLPKGMAPVNGEPFLAILLKQLKQAGFSRFLLLTGYLSDVIESYFKDGTQFGVQISYSRGPVEWDTARRIREAYENLDPEFFLMYSDNFALVPFEQLQAIFTSSKSALTLSLCRKNKGNIRTSIDGSVELYDKSRSAVGLSQVEVGYMWVRRDAIRDGVFHHENFSEVIRELVDAGKVKSVFVPGGYQSISDLERLAKLEQYLIPKKYLLVDRDGVINQKAPRGEYITSWEQFHWIPENIMGLKTLADEGYRFIIVSNQAGIARGMVTHEQLETLNARMSLELAQKGIFIEKFYICPHHWDEHCECRKPKPGMLLKAAEDYLIRLDKTCFIGDDPRDMQAAAAAGILPVYVGDPAELSPSDKELHPAVFQNINELAKELIAQKWFEN